MRRFGLLLLLSALPLAAGERVLQVWGGASSASPLGRGAAEAGAGFSSGPLFTGVSLGVHDLQDASDRALETEYGLDAGASRWHILAGTRIGRLRRSGQSLWLGGAVGRYARSECEIPSRDDPFVDIRPAACVRQSNTDWGPAGGLEMRLSRRLALVVNGRWTRHAGTAIGVGIGMRLGGGPPRF